MQRHHHLLLVLAAASALLGLTPSNSPRARAADRLDSATLFEVREGAIARVYVVRNPNKIKHLQTT